MGVWSVRGCHGSSVEFEGCLGGSVEFEKCRVWGLRENRGGS